MKERPILADVNIWIASTVSEHPHHDSARRWWVETVLPSNTTVAFCRMTQLGLLRLLTNKNVMGRQRQTLSGAWAHYDRLSAQRVVSYVDEPPGLSERMRELCLRGLSSRTFWTDAYLTAFAQCCGFRLATFDRGFKRFEEVDLLLLH